MLNGKIGEWSPDPARSNIGVFLPWSGLMDQLCRAWGRYRSESRMEKVQLWFRPVLQWELAVYRYPSCVTHTRCFLQIIQCEIKVLNFHFQITFIKQVKSKLGSNLGKHFFFFNVGRNDWLLARLCIWRQKMSSCALCNCARKGLHVQIPGLYTISSYFRLSIFYTWEVFYRIFGAVTVGSRCSKLSPGCWASCGWSSLFLHLLAANCSKVTNSIVLREFALEHLPWIIIADFCIFFLNLI